MQTKTILHKRALLSLLGSAFPLLACALPASADYGLSDAVTLPTQPLPGNFPVTSPTVENPTAVSQPFARNFSSVHTLSSQILPIKTLSARRVRFIVVDPITRQPIAGASVSVEYVEDTAAKSGGHTPQWLLTGLLTPAPTSVFDITTWKTVANKYNESGTDLTTSLNVLNVKTEPPSDRELKTSMNTDAETNMAVVTLAAGTSIMLQVPAAPAAQGQAQPPIRDITIIVRATLLRRSEPTPAQVITPNKNSTGAQGNGLIGGGKVTGVSSDSAGQQHVRGEHAEIAYVVDGVLLPDTLSGRQGSIVVPSTIQSLSFLSGAYAPEFGGQTAAILDITTVPGARKPHADVNFQSGSYDTTNGDLTWEGPLGKFASYVFNVTADRSRNALEPQQPDNQTAHNAGSDQSYFSKFRYTPSRKDTLTLTLSNSPSTLQVNNRTGLPASYAAAGQGFGFLGLRNQNGARPDVISDPTNAGYNANLLGAQTLQLGSQQQVGQDITQREINEFAVLNYTRKLSSQDTGQLAMTFLHSGQDVRNQNPAFNLLNLPVDNSIEYSPVAVRNAHHLQFTGSLNMNRGTHRVKAGFLLDDQSDNESYEIAPDSRLALDELAALAPNLAPAGKLQQQTDAQGNAVKDKQGNPVYVKDVNGNPIYTPTSAAVPNVQIHRAGFYRAAYVQDTWRQSTRFTINYGVRADWYRQTQSLGQSIVDTIVVSPRANFSYALDSVTSLRASYNRLFNTPPLAQGAIVGASIQPEILDQYDLSIQRQLTPTQKVSLAYYYKDIRNQVDTGLLIPGSQIGLYSAVNFQIGAVHGIEFAYDIAPKKGRSGIDGYLNYTYSLAAPNGLDNTGTHVPQFNDHDQRNTLGVGLAYDWSTGATVGLEIQHGSGLASSIVPPSVFRTPRTQVNLHGNMAPRVFNGRGNVSLDIVNLFDDRTVINFQSAFSGTRFQQGRRILLSLSGSF